MNNLVRNERIRLVATFFNNIGVAALAAGVIFPLYSSTLVALVKSPPWWLPPSVGLSVGFACHAVGCYVLGKLKE
jgi:hypothetical protein